MNRALKLSIFVVVLGGLACSAAKPKRDVVWPDPPEKPRIKFVTAIKSQNDLDQSSWTNLKRKVFGANTKDHLIHPMGLAVSDDGNRLYIADLRGSDVYVVDFVEKTFKEFQPLGTFQQPCNIALDAEENVYVTDIKAARILVFTKTGQKLRSFGSEMERPTGIVIDRARGVVYAADTSRTQSQNHRVFAYSLDGKMLHEIGRGRGSDEGQFNFPSYLALDADGNLWINDAMNFRLQVFDPEGKFVKALGEQGSRPGQFARSKGIAFDSFGNLYVVDADWAIVQIFNKSFEPLMFFGGRLQKLEWFDLPSAIAIDQKRNRIYIANELLARINVYDLINTSAEDSFTPSAPAQFPPPGGDKPAAGAAGPTAAAQ